MPIRVYHEPGVGAGIALGVADAARAIGDAKIAAAKIKYEAAQEKARRQQQLALGLADQFQRTMMQLAQVKQRTRQWEEAAKRDERRAERAIAAEGRAAEREKQAERRKYHTRHREKYGDAPIGLMAKYGVDDLSEAQRLWREDEQVGELDIRRGELDLLQGYDIAGEQRRGQQQAAEWDRKEQSKNQAKQKAEELKQQHLAKLRGEGWEPTRTGAEDRKYADLYSEVEAIAGDPNIPEDQKIAKLAEIEAEIRQLEPGSGEKKIVVPFEQRLSTHETEDFLWTEQIDGKVTVTKKTPIRNDQDKRREDFADKSLGRLIDTRLDTKPMSADEQANAYFGFLEAYDTGQQQAVRRAINRAWLKKLMPTISQLDEQGLRGAQDQLIERYGANSKDPEARRAMEALVKREELLKKRKAAEGMARMPTPQPAMAPAGGGGYGWLEGGG